MKTSRGCWLTRALSLGLVVVSGTACAPHHRHAHAHAPASLNAPVRGITVQGQGKVTGKPDVARATIGVEARAGTAEAAIAEVNQRMTAVIAAVKQVGVPDADVRTATLSLHFERAYEPPHPVEHPPAPALPAPAPGKVKSADARPTEVAPPPPKLPQGFYTATNSVEVTMRNLDHAGKVVSAATAAGANQLFGIRFEIDDPSPLLAEARKKAVADARQRAERLAQLAGVKLGEPVSITELDSGVPGPMPAFAAMRQEAGAPIERGELTVTTSVQVVYALPE